MNTTKYIWFTFDGCGLHIAKKLKDEGNTVIVAQVQDVSELGFPKEEKPEDKKLRLSTFDGIIEKHDAKEVLKKMKAIKNKDEWFVVFDFNNLWKYSEFALKLGFKNGFFPTKKDWEFEEDRDAGKQFVKDHYTGLEVAEVQEFKTIEEGIKFLEDTDDIWVLKSYDPAGSTVVPVSEDCKEAREEIIGALKLEKSDYEKDGYILEQKIVNAIEITPAIVFYNGKVVFTDIDIENKPIGAGSTGNMTGCSGNLVIKTELSDKINKIAFPPKVYELAKEHTGLFIWDASILIDPRENELYFGEFCANRWGWDSFFTELSMCSSVSDYFNACMQHRNPLVKDYGVGVRLFNLKNHIDVPIIMTDGDSKIWLYDAKKKDDQIVSVGATWDLLVCTSADNNLYRSVKKAYQAVKTVQFTNVYYRPWFDFVSREYDNSIINRFLHSVGFLYDAQNYSDDCVSMSEINVIKQIR